MRGPVILQTQDNLLERAWFCLGHVQPLAVQVAFGLSIGKGDQGVNVGVPVNRPFANNHLTNAASPKGTFGNPRNDQDVSQMMSVNLSVIF
jgi:hypothetical protein